MSIGISSSAVGIPRSLVSSSFVSLDGNQNIAGIKTFSSNLGIGTNTPLAKLHIQGAMAGGVDGADTVGIRLTNTNGNTWRISSGAGGINNGTFTIFQVGQPQFTGERFVITNTGNVGIGTTTPAAKLSIVDTALAGSGSLSGSALEIAQTWNTTGAPAAIKLNVTDTASNAASLLMDLQVGGNSKIVAAKDGSIRFGSGGGINLTQYGAAINGNRSGILGDFGSGGTLYLSGPIRFSAVGIDVGGGSDTVFTRDAANTLAQRNSTNAQTFRLYNTYTDASNYERLGIIWSGNAVTIRTESAGSGVSRPLILGVGNGGQWFINSAGGHLQTYGSDGIYDIGAPSSNRPRNIYITGHLAASTKSFKIPHQTKSGYLQYGVVESNEHSVYVRGESSEDTITLPDHWEWLVDEDSITVQLTCVGKFMPLYIIDKNNKKVIIGGVEGNYNYTIYGTRKDVPDLIVETEE